MASSFFFFLFKYRSAQVTITYQPEPIIHKVFAVSAALFSIPAAAAFKFAITFLEIAAALRHKTIGLARHLSFYA